MKFVGPDQDFHVFIFVPCSPSPGRSWFACLGPRSGLARVETLECSGLAGWLCHYLHLSSLRYLLYHKMLAKSLVLPVKEELGKSVENKATTG